MTLSFDSIHKRGLELQFCLLLLCCWLTACNYFPWTQAHSDPRGRIKTVSFAILEDYDKGEDLNEVAKDFQLMKELGIDVLRCSLGWDDYEPVKGQYDFAWLKAFVSLALQHGIKLRPYIGYTPRWAAADASSDGMDWNNPPADYRAWYEFVYNLAYTLRDYPNVLSYEIYNEQNAKLWWDGSIEQYKETLRYAAIAIRAADPDAQVLLGGFVLPDSDWLRSIAGSGYARYYDVTPFHAYAETWTTSDVVVENYLDMQYRQFVHINHSLGEGEPIWINEMGFATTPDKSELDQANWWARAVSTFLAEPEIEHIGVYEIKDLPLGKDTIGDQKNHYLGLARADRTRKLAFHTVALLKNLLGSQRIQNYDRAATLTVSNGTPSNVYWHLFKRADGKRVLFVYDKGASPTVQISLQTGGSTAYKYELSGASAKYADFDGRILSNIRLTPGNVVIFRIDP
jgi:polysaccharide biosynthesis protein PslG